MLELFVALELHRFLTFLIWIFKLSHSHSLYLTHSYTHFLSLSHTHSLSISQVLLPLSGWLMLFHTLYMDPSIRTPMSICKELSSSTHPSNLYNDLSVWLISMTWWPTSDRIDDLLDWDWPWVKRFQHHTPVVGAIEVNVTWKINI